MWIKGAKPKNQAHLHELPLPIFPQVHNSVNQSIIDKVTSHDKMFSDRKTRQVCQNLFSRMKQLKHYIQVACLKITESALGISEVSLICFLLRESRSDRLEEIAEIQTNILLYHLRLGRDFMSRISSRYMYIWFVFDFPCPISQTVYNDLYHITWNL